MEAAEINNRFSFHPATDETGPQHDIVRAKCMELAYSLNELVPEGRNKSLMFTHLEEVMFRGNAAIATNA